MRLLPWLLLVTGCGPAGNTDGSKPPTTFGEGLFEEGCPTADWALAREIGVDATLPGEIAVGTRGDFLIANDRAAFVITDAVGQSTYWYYGGALADAVPMDGCAPGVDKLRDMGMVFATLNLLQLPQSIARAFRAEKVEVINDGSDGKAAIVRATGTDDMHWLAEYNLVRMALAEGSRPVSQPYGTEITVDYILPPNSEVLQIDVTLKNTSSSQLNLMEALLVNFGESLTTYSYSSDDVSIGGFEMAGGLPWMMSTDGEGAYAVGVANSTLVSLEIAGIRILADLIQVTGGNDLLPGESARLTSYFAVGAKGGSSATAPLLRVNPVPIRNQPAGIGRIQGKVENATDVSIVVEAQSPAGAWGILDVIPVGADGSFSVVVPDFERTWSYRVFVRGEGRDDSRPMEVTAGQTGLSLVAEPAGSLSYTIEDADGAPSPGRIHLQRTDGAVVEDWLKSTGELGVPPGTWQYTVTRGYEFEPARGQIIVPEDGAVRVHAVLDRVVDTTGWISVDTHVHTADSPDSSIKTSSQIVHAAAHGLEVVVHTEHENIVERSYLPVEEGVDAWTNSVTGEEVTSIAVEHLTMFPVVPDGSPRGGFIEWYDKDIEQLFHEIRSKSGDGVALLNHPNYLLDIQWDRIHAEPGIPDQSVLGLAEGAALWTWNMDGIEIMNGHNNIWIDGNKRFDNWMSMLNAGHRMVGVGCSDDHQGWEVGFPRSYYRSTTDDPSTFRTAELIHGYQNGELITSAGGFARVSVGGAGPGELVTDTSGSVVLQVQLEALPEVDMTHFVVFANCDQVDSVRVTNPGGVEKYSGVVPVSVVGDTHLVIAAFGSTMLPPGLPQYDATIVPRVVTNPIYIDGDGDGVFSAPGGRECTYNLDVSQAF